MPKLTVNEAAYGFTDVIKLTYNDLITIGNGGQKVIATIPAGGGVDRCVVYESVPVAGTTSLVIDVGTTLADPDEFIDALGVLYGKPERPMSRARIEKTLGMHAYISTIPGRSDTLLDIIEQAGFQGRAAQRYADRFREQLAEQHKQREVAASAHKVAYRYTL